MMNPDWTLSKVKFRAVVQGRDERAFDGWLSTFVWTRSYAGRSGLRYSSGRIVRRLDRADCVDFL